MAFYTWIHYNAFISLSSISVHKLTYLFSQLSKPDQDEFLRRIGAGVVQQHLQQDTPMVST
jgi:hypothetical protein